MKVNTVINTLLVVRVYGFGYDSFFGEFKLVSISYFIDLHNGSFNLSMGVYLSGALHWAVTRDLEPESLYLIVAFDLWFEVLAMEEGIFGGISDPV
ncbi:hypothetical protein RYX36_022541 [Vicia faba]